MVKPSCNFLSDKLREYYDNHGVTDLESYIQKGSSSPQHQKILQLAQRQQQQGLRYIRLNPRYDAQETLALLEEEIKNQFSNETSLLIKKVTWMPTVLGYYAIPDSFSLSQSVAYRSGRIYGMDVSSGAAVAALLLDDDDEHYDVPLNAVEDDRVEKTTPIMRILDLCCAPGLKTCAIMDILSTDIKCRAHVVGVDISEKRLQLCKNVIRKYHLDPDTSCGTPQQRRLFLNSNGASTSVTSTKDSNVTIQLFQTDGTTFGRKKCQERDINALKFDSQVTKELMMMCRNGNRKRMNKSAKAREQKRLKEIMSTNSRLEERRRLVQPAAGASGAAGASSVVATTITTSPTNDNIASTRDEDHEEIVIPLFDRVLVDAECSTDGAIRHLWHKCKKSSMTTNNHHHHHKDNLEENLKLTDSLQLKELVELQKN
jgi:tRNA and rRNA cytosine-C5-methylases